MDKKKRRFTFSVGPLGMSLVAAAVTAAAFAAISLADSGSGSAGGKTGSDERVFSAPAPPGGGAGVFFRDDLSDADKQKLENFRQCMEDNGAPAPPEPGEIDPSNPPKPPSAADREKLRKAFEACKDKLPADMQKAGPPQVHAFGCGPGAPHGTEHGKDHDQEQSNDSSGSSSGSDS